MALVLIVLLVVSCGGDTVATTLEVTSTPPITTLLSTTTSTRPTVTTTTSPATTTTARTIDVFYEGGQVVGPGRFGYTVGDQVSVWVLSDADDEIHVHGYDVVFPVKSGIPVEVSLTADVPGIFEIELESTHTLLFELEVSP